jgi:hypothetical protein
LRAFTRGHGGLHRDGAGHRAVGVVFPREGRAEEHQEAVAEHLVDGAPVLEDDLGHAREEVVDDAQDVLGGGAGRRGEAAQVGHDHRHAAQLATQLEAARLVQDGVHHVVAQVATEGLADELVAQLELARALGHLELEAVVELRVLDGDGGLRGEQLQHLDAVAGERAARQVVLEVDEAAQRALVLDGRAEDGARLAGADVRVLHEVAAPGRVFQHDGAACREHPGARCPRELHGGLERVARGVAHHRSRHPRSASTATTCGPAADESTSTPRSAPAFSTTTRMRRSTRRESTISSEMAREARVAVSRSRTAP